MHIGNTPKIAGWKTGLSRYKNQQLSAVFSYSALPFPGVLPIKSPSAILGSSMEDTQCRTQIYSLPCSPRSTKNQLALEAAIMELTLWVEQRGAADVAENVRGALEAIDRNEEFIKMTLAVMMTP
jgi:hypothetical protein